MTFDINSLKNAVRLNCNISDARYSGTYSVCNLALRLRDLYKWENNLAPWEEKDSDIILDWIGEREEAWETLAEKNFIALDIQGATFDPFDTEGINTTLSPRNLIYGAGYAHGLKPTFFLANCDKTVMENGTTIHILGHELARDLLTLPAMAQNGTVLLRKTCAKLYLWDQIVYIRKSARPSLLFALNTLGVDGTNLQSVKKNFETIFSAQKNTYVHHELGEIHDSVFNQDIWRQLIAAFPQTPVELVTRVVKDMLADTHSNGTLPHISKEKNTAALGFYMAFLGHLTGMLFPALMDAFTDFMKTHRWDSIHKTISTCRETAREYAKFISDTFLEGQTHGKLPWAKAKIEYRFLEQLKLDNKR